MRMGGRKGLSGVKGEKREGHSATKEQKTDH